MLEITGGILASLVYHFLCAGCPLHVTVTAACYLGT